MNNFIKRVLFILILICSVICTCNKISYANDQYYIRYETSELKKCLENDPKASSGNTDGMLMCYYDEIERLDKLLNIEYKKIMIILKQENSEENKILMNSIKEAQRAWIKYVDIFSEILYDPYGGTMAKLDSAMFIYREKLLRLNDLMNLQITQH